MDLSHERMYFRCLDNEKTHKAFSLLLLLELSYGNSRRGRFLVSEVKSVNYNLCVCVCAHMYLGIYGADRSMLGGSCYCSFSSYSQTGSFTEPGVH